MEAASLQTRLRALRKRKTPETMPLWSAACDPAETLLILSDVDEPWGALIRAEAYLRKDMTDEAQIELQTLPQELPPGIMQMKAALEQRIALYLSQGGHSYKDEDAPHSEGPLQQWLARVRAFRTRS